MHEGGKCRGKPEGKDKGTGRMIYRGTTRARVTANKKLEETRTFRTGGGSGIKVNVAWA